MENASWIWYPGEFEIYHNKLVQSRRENKDFQEISFWQVAEIYPKVDFFYDFCADEDFTVTAVVPNRTLGYIKIDYVQYPLNTPITIKKGSHSVSVNIMNPDGGLPCLFIDSKCLKTSDSWLCSNGSENKVNAATVKFYDSPDFTPETFFFSYKKIDYISKKDIDGGVLLDYGRETYGKITLENVSGKLLICYGESENEAIDKDFSELKEFVDKDCTLRCRAFRYIAIFGDNADRVNVTFQYEYLPIKDIGTFCCDDETVKKVFDTCAYTFHLNSREFLLDGIKRDHWTWSGDAYQASMVSNYLYFNPDIIKRTILALLGKPPYLQHINTINDYTFYLFITVYDYYFSTGDKKFVEFIFNRLNSLYQFAVSRLDENGFVVGRKNDWIFIDWSDIDKQGPISAEQILFWKATLCMAEISKLCGQSFDEYLSRADNLRAKTLKCFWNDEKQAFIDSFESGKNAVSRHANIFAVLYDFVDIDKQKIIYESVLCNDNIQQITTPFFKFFELSAQCKLGQINNMQNMLDSYWGGMLNCGATTIWEQFDPTQSGDEHYEMYGAKYGKSLCHIWGAGPIYLLGRYCLGVYPTSVAYKTFNIEPNLGKYKSLSGVVPLPNGYVEIKYNENTLTIMSTNVGGSLLINNKCYEIKKNTLFSVEII